jgi:hypothetical protein
MLSSPGESVVEFGGPPARSSPIVSPTLLRHPLCLSMMQPL